MRVAVLTMFNGLSTIYSLVNVVAEQLKMLLDAGIHTRLLVSEDCPGSERHGIYSDERLEWVKVINHLNGARIQWYDYSEPEAELHASFFDEADAVAADLCSKLSDVDVCMLHDIHYQGLHLMHNVAVRKVQQSLPKLRFIAFTHSVPVNRTLDVKWPFSARFTPMPNTTYVYPTNSGIPALAKQYNVPEGRCRVVYNSLDMMSYMSEPVQKVGEHIDLLSPDILIVYPCRFTTAKRFDKVAALAGTIKRTAGVAVKAVFCDFPSLDIEPMLYKAAILK